MEQDPEAKGRELERVKADANPTGKLKNPIKIKDRDLEAAKAEDRAEAKVPDKVGIRAVFRKNKISKT
jgi:hypothetical protein